MEFLAKEKYIWRKINLTTLVKSFWPLRIDEPCFYVAVISFAPCSDGGTKEKMGPLCFTALSCHLPHPHCLLLRPSFLAVEPEIGSLVFVISLRMWFSRKTSCKGSVYHDWGGQEGEDKNDLRQSSYSLVPGESAMDL